MEALPRSYRLFLVGNGISQLGDWLRAMAINWLIVNELRRTSVEGNINRLAVAIATILFTMIVSSGFASSGLLWKKRRSSTGLQAKTVVLIGAVWSMLMSSLLAGLVAFDMLTFWTLIWLGIAGAAMSVFVGPSTALLDRELAGQKQLRAQLRRDQIMFLMRGFVGIFSGAVLLKGTWLLLAVDALTFLPLIAILCYLRRSSPVSAGVSEGMLGNSFFRGLGIIFCNGGLLVAFGLSLTRDAFVSIGFSLTAEIVKLDLKESGLAYGTWLSITGFAGFIGSILYEWLGKGSLARQLPLYALCVMGVPLAMICAGSSPNLTLYTACYAAFVFMVSPADSTFRAIIRGLPTEQIGCVDRVNLTLQSGLCPLLWFLVTWAGQSMELSAQQTLAASATFGFVSTAILLICGFTIVRKRFVRLFDEEQ